MMKNLLITLFTAFMFSASFGQALDLEAKLLDPSTDTIHDSGINFTLQIKNNGPTNMNAGDTIFYGASSNGTLIFSSGITLGTGGLNSGDSISFSRTLIPPTHPTTPTYETICIIIAAQSSYTDANTANNSDCYVWSRSLVSTPEVTLEETTKVFVANGILNLSSTSMDNLTYTVVSITGQVVSQGTFTSNKQVDLTGVAKGVYAIVVTNGTEKITKKVAVQ